MNFKLEKINLLLLGVLFLNICPLFSQTVTPWITSGDKSKLLQQQNTVGFASTVGSANVTLSVDPTVTYQTIDGFGFTLTEGSAEVISSLTSQKQTALLNSLFSTTTGLGISVLRVGIGATDLSSSAYSYNETSGDESMSKFSLAGPDLNYLIPILKKVLLINPQIKILATPWSAPRWMKSNGSWYGGSLNSKYCAAYAKYFIKYFDAMKAQGINVWAITPQNEPENGNNEPSMTMTQLEQVNFINNFLGPAKSAAGYASIKIIAFDHNCDNSSYPIFVCKNSPYVDGAAFHLYGGDISTLTTVKNATGKNVYFTEQYTGKNGDFSGDFGWHMENVIIGSMNNYSKIALEWNLANNSSYGPHTTGGCTDCLGGVTVNSASSYVENVSYYIVGQISKFVKSGAVRIKVATTISGNLSCGFKNPDGSIAVVVYNNNSNSQTYKLVSGGKAFTYVVPAKSAATFVWNSNVNAVSAIRTKDFEVSPNPASNFIVLKNLNDKQTYKSVEIISINGITVIHEELDATASMSKVDVSSLKSGLYLIRLATDNEFVFSRFLKE